MIRPRGSLQTTNRISLLQSGQISWRIQIYRSNVSPRANRMCEPRSGWFWRLGAGAHWWRKMEKNETFTNELWRRVAGKSSLCAGADRAGISREYLGSSSPRSSNSWTLTTLRPPQHWPNLISMLSFSCLFDCICHWDATMQCDCHWVQSFPSPAWPADRGYCFLMKNFNSF